MKKLLTILGVAGLSLTVAACGTSSEFTGSSSLSEECRTAGFDCVEQKTETVKKSKDSSKKATRVFEYSNRK